MNGAIRKVVCTQVVSFHSARDDQAVAREVRPHALGARVAGSDPVAASGCLDQHVGDGDLWQGNMESNLCVNNTLHIEEKNSPMTAYRYPEAMYIIKQVLISTDY